jgi:UDP-MurNAc hydroxylase
LRVTYLACAGVVIEDNNVKVLCDPWLIDGEYYGSWYHYPPFEFNPDEFANVDYIYITHIHPDHFSKKTLARLNKNIPVIIHKYESEFLRGNIERLGFEVIELEHNLLTRLRSNLKIRILSADNCDPQLCSKFLGCSISEPKLGLTSIDTMAVFDNGRRVVVNTNDCPYELSYSSLKIIKENYRKIDFLMVGYSGAGPYPQCFCLNEKQMKAAGNNKKQHFLNQAEMYVNMLQPTFYMPFAGQYTLAGKLSFMNDIRGVPELEEAIEYMSQSPNIDQSKSKCVILNSKGYLDLETRQFSEDYVPVDLDLKRQYILKELSKVRFDYEFDSEPSVEELKELIPASYRRFELRRREIGFWSDTLILISLSSELYIGFSFDGNGYRYIGEKQIRTLDHYVKLSLDRRLLKRILRGPAFAHWNNAEIGSHIRYDRKPNIFERGAYHCINFFHC